jgi:hypothetical protein
VVRILIDRGASVEATDERGQNCLHKAASAEILKILMDSVEKERCRQLLDQEDSFGRKEEDESRSHQKI